VGGRRDDVRGEGRRISEKEKKERGGLEKPTTS